MRVAVGAELERPIERKPTSKAGASAPPPERLHPERLHPERLHTERLHPEPLHAERPVQFIANELPVLTIETLREVVLEATTTLQNRLNGFEEQLKSSVLEVAKDSVLAYDRIRESQAELQGEKEKLQTGVAQLESRVAELEEAIVQSHREVQAERQANRVALGQVQSLEATIATLRQEHASQRNELEQQAATLQKHVTSLSEALDAEKAVNEQSREQSTTTSQSFREALQQVQSELAAAQTELNATRSELQRVQQQWNEAEQQRKVAAEEIERLRLLLEEARNEISDYHSAKESESKTVDGLQLRLHSVHHELEMLKQEHQVLLNNRDELQAIVANLQAQLESAQAAARVPDPSPREPSQKTESLANGLTQSNSGSGLTVSRMNRLAQIEASLRQSKKEEEAEAKSLQAEEAIAEQPLTSSLQAPLNIEAPVAPMEMHGGNDEGLYGGATMQLPPGGFEQPQANMVDYANDGEHGGELDGATAMLNLPPLDSNASWYGDAPVQNEDDGLPTWWTRGPSVAVQEEHESSSAVTPFSSGVSSESVYGETSSIESDEPSVAPMESEAEPLAPPAPAPRVESAAEILARLDIRIDEEEESSPRLL